MVQFLKVPVNGNSKILKINNSWAELIFSGIGTLISSFDFLSVCVKYPFSSGFIYKKQ